MINTCIWFQWLPGRLEKAPAGLQWGGSSEHAREEERPYFVYVLLLLFYFVLLNTLFVARHPWLPRPSFPEPRTSLHWCRNPGRGSRHTAVMQPASPATEWEWTAPRGTERPLPPAGGRARAHHLSPVLSPAIPCPPFCRGGSGKAWAGLLEMRGPGALPGPMSHDGGGIAGPGPRLGCPRLSRAVPDTCEYQGGYISGLGGFGL